MRWRKAMVFVPALGLLAACGGGPTPEVFVARAEERCSKMVGLFPREQLPAGASAAEHAELNLRRAESFRRAHRELRSLDAPPELRDEFGRYLDRAERQAENRLEYARALPAGDQRQLRYLDEEFRALNDTKNALRRRLGFRIC